MATTYGTVTIEGELVGDTTSRTVEIFSDPDTQTQATYVGTTTTVQLPGSSNYYFAFTATVPVSASDQFSVDVFGVSSTNQSSVLNSAVQGYSNDSITNAVGATAGLAGVTGNANK